MEHAATDAVDVAPVKLTACEVPMVACLTVVLWIGCLLIGAIGLRLPYARALRAPQSEPQPVKAELVHVELTDNQAGMLEEVSVLPSDTMTPPPPPASMVLPAMPAFVPVAETSPAVSFAVAVDATEGVGPEVQSAEGSSEIISAPSPATVVSPDRQLLQFGRGEGRQPAPEYPAAARRLGQEGTVRVEFTVGEDGRVLAAELASSSPWPLLNNSALRAVRNRWRVREGTLRRFAVEIVFQLRK